MNHPHYLELALDEAFSGMHANEGGPFGAIIVSAEGDIIGRGRNQVIATNDPTAHAEVTAIRDACRRMGNFHLEGAVLYTSCEPCPMCLSAIYWAHIKAVYYGSDRHDAGRIGFADKFIYDELEKPPAARAIHFECIRLPRADELMAAWVAKSDKTPY